MSVEKASSAPGDSPHCNRKDDISYMRQMVRTRHVSEGGASGSNGQTASDQVAPALPSEHAPAEVDRKKIADDFGGSRFRKTMF